MGSKLENIKKLGNLTLSQMRAYGTKTKIRPNQVKIGGVKSGLYYDKDLPFLKTRIKKNDKGRPFTHYYLRGQGKRPSDIINVQSWDRVKGKKVVERVRRDDPRLNWYSNASGSWNPTLLEFGGMTKGEKIAKPLAKKILDNPKKYGALDDKGNVSIHKVSELINAKFADAGLRPYAGFAPVNRILREIRGQIKFPIIGTPKETEIVNFLKKDDLYKTITSTDVTKEFPDVPDYIIHRIRQANKLSRTNIGDTGGTSKTGLARRKLERMIKKKYKNLTDEQVEAVAENGRTFLQSKRHTPVQPSYGSRYADEDLQVAFNFLEDTFLKYMPREINEYAFERALNNLRKELTGKKWTAGHSRRSPEDWWWFGGDEVGAISPQLGGLNLEQLKLDSAFQAAIRKGDIATAEKKMIEMMQKGMRSSMAEGRMVRNPKTGKDEWDDEFGELIFYGAPPKKGKMAEGGIVNGYNKGGKVMKLLDDAIGMMSRRKFLKGMGATAAQAVIPKGAIKLAPAAIKKGALNFAPPWVNGMLSSLKSVKDLGAFGQRRSAMGGGMNVGNNAKIINLGSKKIKLYKDETATETYFRVKTSDQVKTEEMIEGALPGIKNQDQFWDDIVLREEKGQTTITWKNKEYDSGNDQHIVIDKLNKETRFVDDNWHMEAGGEDIAKDDWIEWAITPNKNEIKVALKKPLSEIDDLTLDGYSVRDMDNTYSGMFESFVDSFSPSGNVFGTVQRMSQALKKKSVLRREKKWNDEQVRNLKEKEMLDWEDQFRGGKGIHGYHEGGLLSSVKEFFTGPGYAELPAQANNWLSIQGNDQWDGLSKKQLHPKLLTFDNPESGIRASVVSLASRAARKNKSSSLSLNQIFFEEDPWAEDQDAYAGYLKDMGLSADKTYDMSNRDDVFSLINTMAVMEMGREDYNSINIDKRNKVFNEGIDMAYQRLVSSEYEHNSIYENKFAGGGIARRPNAVPPLSGPDPYATFIEDSVSQIRSSPSEYMGAQFMQKFNKGGFVKKVAPAVIGKLTNYKPKLTMSDVLKNVQKAKKGKTKTTTTLKSMEPKAEEPGALFWGSREKIIGAPTEAMTARQWLQYMKIGKHGILNPKGYPRIKDMELNDTSLAPWLSRAGNKTISKDVLVKQFDEMAPQIDVLALGEAGGMRTIQELSTKLSRMDTQEIRNPAVKGFFDYVKSVMPVLKSSTNSKDAKAVIKGIDDMVFNNFGVKNALDEGVPQRFPFEIKEVLQQLSTGLGKRTAGFKTYRRDPQHRGTQMMSGGDNYREFLFRYNPGSLRTKEPTYKYAHDFNLDSAERVGGIVHTRTTDRADQFGRRLLHIEEIQSDMHQKINAAQRKLKRMHADWAEKGKTPEGEYAKMTTQGKKNYDQLVSEGKYAPRGDLKEEVATANEQHLLLLKSKIDDLLAQKQTAAIKTRLVRLNKERTKVRKIIDDEKKKMAEGKHSGVPQGPLSKTEDYNEFIMKYLLRVAREGGYDGITINTPAIKNVGMSPTGKDYKGNLVAYGPMAKGAMEKAAKKSGAKFMKTVIMDENNRAWEVPMILIKENKAAQALIDKGLPVYKKGGTVKK